MYLLMPTTHNVNRIIKDFTNQKQYAGAHLFFIEGDYRLGCNCYGPSLTRVLAPGLPESLFQQLTSSPAEPHLLGLKELFLNIHGLFNFSTWENLITLCQSQ